MPELKDLCSDWMKKNVTVDNVLEIVKLAESHSSLQIESHAFYFILRNFEKKLPQWEKFAEEHPKVLNDFLVRALELRRTYIE